MGLGEGEGGPVTCHRAAEGAWCARARAGWRSIARR